MDGRCISAILLIFFWKLSTACEKDNFLCAGGKCLSRDKVCDGFLDCDEGDDENNCEEIKNCAKPTWFRCNSGECLSSLLYCDGEFDCKDHSDEPKNCTPDGHMTHVERACGPEEFTCVNKECVKNTWVCDGEPDCSDGSDETVECEHRMNCDGGFRCKNKHCIIHEFQCDGDNDCGDNSDEENCTMVFHSVEHCTEDSGLFLCTDKIVCLENKYVCDGFPHCFDKSDETECSLDQKLNETHCKSIGCSHSCHLAPNHKIVCTCPSGYRLDASLKKCVDINECDEFGFCYQKCKNSIGGYQCSCDLGYVLMSDNRTCKAIGGEPLLLFSSSNQIRGIYLKSLIYFSVATQLNQVIGVSHNGKSVYWSEINKFDSAIMRSNEDGTDKEVLINSGLGLPEDLAVDYVTKNIYFTDVDKKHIGVCTETAICAVLHNENIDKPRAIALYPQKGIMYWTDWGKIPQIATSGMDGSNSKSVVHEGIDWPNGLTLDTSNDRLYWVDAKALTIETVRLDGTDRRVVLKNSVKHPFSIAVFEEMLYWSDWNNVQIEKCNKFTGKNHSSLVKEKRVHPDKVKHSLYGVHIYHPALHPRVANPCNQHSCSHLCLLSPNNTYKCACPDDFSLGADLHTCRRISKTLQVAIAGKTHISFISPRLLGKQSQTRLNLGDHIEFIECLTFDSLTSSLIISDSVKKKIYRYNLQTKQMSALINAGLGKVVSMSFDSYGNNLYLCDQEKMNVEVWSLMTKYNRVVFRTSGGEMPESVVVVPDHGIFFVSVSSPEGKATISRVNMDGTQIFPFITGSKILGPKVILAYDKKTQKVFWTDEKAEIIEVMNLNGYGRRVVQVTEGTPRFLSSQDGLLMWVNMQMDNFYTFDTSNEDMNFNKKTIIKLEMDDFPLSLVPITQQESLNIHPCQDFLVHGCSHLCLVSNKSHGVCSCPLGLRLASDNKTCINHAQCSDSQFKCRTDDICISRIQRCDGHVDCPSGEDEKDCETNNCRDDQFKCTNGQCVALKERCDNEFDCSDHSDEVDCPNNCQDENTFQCGSGECIPKLWKCDFTADCHDESDEHGCEVRSCPADMFRCKSGSCISKRWECDGDIDCVDASDEHENCETSSCAEDEFRCGNKRCVSIKFLCDGMNDCGDNTDELNCKEKEVQPSCGPEEILCSNVNAMCVPERARCNGTTECPRGEDEMDCANCLPSEFQCKNFKCIYRKWMCDKENDCEDNSDEDPVLCAHRMGSIGSSHSCEDFSCTSGECLPLHLVCNGIKNCEDGSDEGKNCDSVCKTNPCDHLCMATPVAARCACHKGFILSSDGHSCTDIDECAEEKCSQICHNIPGGFNCSCVQDYLLKSDRMTCKAKGGRMSFIMSGDDEIRKISHNFNHMDLLVFDPGAQILGLDVDTRKNQIYWSSGSSNRINVLDVATGQKIFMEGMDRPSKISYDWLTGNVFYVDNSNPNSIKVCNLIQKKRSTVFTVQPGVVISQIAVDPSSGLIFYSLVRSSTLQRPISEILVYSLADGNSTSLVSSDVSWVSGIAIDRIRRFIYWSDLYYQVIEKIRFDGKQRQVVFQSQVHRPESLILFEDSLLWMTRGSGEFKKCVLYGEHKGHCETTTLYVYDIRFLTIMQEVRQPNMTNPCTDTCDMYAVCVATSSGPKCLCHDGSIIAPNEICEHTSGKTFDARYMGENSKQFLTSQKKLLPGSCSAVIGTLVTVLVVCGAAAGYLWFRKKKSNVVLETMHFQNPSFGLSHFESENHHQGLIPGDHRYENPVAKLVQHPNGKLEVFLRENEHKSIRRGKSEIKDYDSDSDTYDRTDMKANLIR